jgi:hypothetical protein
MSDQSDKIVVRNLYIMGVGFVVLTAFIAGVAASIA